MAVRTSSMTVEEFARFAELPANADRQYEYIGGEVVEVVPNNYSSAVGMLMGALLLAYVREHQLGWVTGADGGYRVMGERYIPDVAFISREKQPEPSYDAYNPQPPDLAVEVLSPNNDPVDMRIKVVNYLRAGTVVWIVDPDRRRVEVYAPDQAPHTVGVKDTIEGGAVLPGLKLAVQGFFPS